MKSSVCHCIALRRANKDVTEYYDRMLAPCGVTVGQFSLMRTLERMESPSVSELARKMRLERSTLVRTLRPLLDAGLIGDEAAPGTRNRSLGVTRKGKQVLRAGGALWNKAQKGFEKALGPDNLVAWRGMLDALRQL